MLDEDDIPFTDIQQNMQELNTINTYLGGHAVSLAGLKKLLQSADPKELIQFVKLAVAVAIIYWRCKTGVQRILST